MGGKPNALLNNLTILIDTREQQPLSFPANIVMRRPSDGKPTSYRVRTEKHTLSEGDYALAGYEGCCLIERKGQISEVYQNVMSKDLPRFIRAIDRMAAACDHPMLLLEATLSQLGQPTKLCPEPQVALDTLQRLCAERGITFFLAPGNSTRYRVATGELVARTLINHAVVELTHGNRRTVA